MQTESGTTGKGMTDDLTSNGPIQFNYRLVVGTRAKELEMLHKLWRQLSLANRGLIMFHTKGVAC